MCTNDQLKAAYALNLCTVSIAQIVDYNDIGILMQEYDNILNNLNIEKMPKDDALLEIFERIIDTINSCYISAEDKKLIDAEYQNRMKNAVWSAVPHLGLIFATGNPIAIAMNLATQVGISYMNYRRNKAEYQQGREREYWQIEKSDLEMISGLQQSLFGTSWQLAKTYNFPDEYRLTNQQVKDYNSTLLEDDPIKRYNSLSFMKDKFKAYPHFWYQMGSTANSIYRSEDLDISDSTRTMYKGHAIECFEHYRKLNKFNLLRQDAITSAWALEYIDLLDLNDENDREKAKELLEEAEAHAGTAKDVLELCAYAALNLGNYDDAIKLFKFLVNNDYNLEINARILSALLIYNFRDPEKRDSVLSAYENISGVARKYLLPIPSTEEEWANFKPDWAKDEVSADTANTSLTEGNASAALSDMPTDTKSVIVPSQNAEDAIDRIIGWAAKKCSFIGANKPFYSTPIAFYETQNYYLILYWPHSPECPCNMQQMRVDKRNGDIAYFDLDGRAKGVMYTSDVYNGQAYISSVWQTDYYSKSDELYFGCEEGLLKVSLDTMQYERIDFQAQNRADDYELSGYGNKIVLAYEHDCRRIYIYDIAIGSIIRLTWNEDYPIEGDVLVCAGEDGVYISAPDCELLLFNYEGKFITSICKPQSQYNIIYHIRNRMTFYVGDYGKIFPARLVEERVIKLVAQGGIPEETELDILTDKDFYTNAVVKSYPDCLMYVSKEGAIKMVEYQSGITREIAEGATYLLLEEHKHLFKKEYEPHKIVEDFLRVGQYVYFYQSENGGVTEGSLVKASISAPGSVQAVRLYDSLEEAGLA